MTVTSNGGAGGAGGAGSTQAGGNGGSAGQGGQSTSVPGGTSGGTGSNGGDGASGNGSTASGGGGGGGGGAGTLPFVNPTPVGGNGGKGGDGSATTAADGGYGGGGGGGGGAGSNNAVGGTRYDGYTMKGGDGGDGGSGAVNGGSDGSAQFGDGGNGGGGGAGMIVPDSTNGFVGLGPTNQVTGGAGGAGGSGAFTGGAVGGGGGNGGDGGDGVFAGDSNTFTNEGVIKGGRAGNGGSGYTAGQNGAYGAGVVGSNLTLTNSGTIFGGLDSNGLVHGDGLIFTGGTNSLTLSSDGVAGTILGNISAAGSLDILSGGTATSLSGAVLVFGAAATTVTIESGVTLKDDVTGFVAGDTLDFKAVAYSTKLEAVFTASATGGDLRIVDSTHPTNVVESLTLIGIYTSGVFGLSSDGNGGTTIGFIATPALGMQPNDVATSDIPGSSALVVVDRYNSDYSLYYEDTITKASNGNYTFHFAGGSFFNGKSFQSFDNVTNSAGLLLNQTLYDANGNSTQYTTFNANGTTYQQAAISRPAAGEILYHYDAGSFFTGKPYSAFDNLATTGGTLLDQILYNRDGSHTFTVPGSNLTLTAQKTDTFNVSGQNDTTRFNATGFGADTFNGYKTGDIFSFSTSIFANYAALQQHLSGTSSAVITDTKNDTLALANVAKSSVTSSMFTFS